jgi:hypothetical protein
VRRRYVQQKTRPAIVPALIKRELELELEPVSAEELSDVDGLPVELGTLVDSAPPAVGIKKL